MVGLTCRQNLYKCMYIESFIKHLEYKSMNGSAICCCHIQWHLAISVFMFRGNLCCCSGFYIWCPDEMRVAHMEDKCLNNHTFSSFKVFFFTFKIYTYLDSKLIWYLFLYVAYNKSSGPEAFSSLSIICFLNSIFRCPENVE